MRFFKGFRGARRNRVFAGICCAVGMAFFLSGASPVLGAEGASCPLSDHLEVLGMMEKMSPREKLGQLLLLSFSGKTLSPEVEELLATYRPGGLILYSSRGNIGAPEDVAELTASLQAAARRLGMPPLFIAIDQEGGLVDRITRGITRFPGNMALGAAGDPDFAERQARIMARELRALGITWNFAPVVDVNSNPANPVINIRSFGEDPGSVALLGSRMVAPYEEEKVLCAAKHYPGHGDTAMDSHAGLPRVSRPLETLRKVDLLPFRAMIAAGVPAVMTAHVVVPALEPATPERPATLSPEVLGTLREEGFQGIVVTDSMGMGAIRKHWGAPEAGLMALNAGADVLLYGADPQDGPATYREVFGYLSSALHTGGLSPERLEESVLRVLSAKGKLGLFEAARSFSGKERELGRAEDQETAREIARRSITLLENRGNLLPLDGKTPVPLLVPEKRRKNVQPLLAAVPQFEPLYVPSSGLGEESLAALETAPLVACASWGLGKTPELKVILNRCAPEEVLFLALRSPYDFLEISSPRGGICTYGDVPVSLEALGKLLLGKLRPQGRLPVELPGLYPRGFGRKKL